MSNNSPTEDERNGDEPVRIPAGSLGAIESHAREGIEQSEDEQVRYHYRSILQHLDAAQDREEIERVRDVLGALDELSDAPFATEDLTRRLRNHARDLDRICDEAEALRAIDNGEDLEIRGGDCAP